LNLHNIFYLLNFLKLFIFLWRLVIPNLHICTLLIVVGFALPNS